jgi:putative proteasome-type protease
MTYCVAISVNDGLVFCSDSRTNAGPDMLSSYSKMHIFNPASGRTFVLLAAGNLATTQSIVHHIESDLENAAAVSLLSCSKMVDAARYVSQLSHNEIALAQQATATSGIDTSVSLIFGGQIQGAAPAMYLMYTAGNFITEPPESPFLQIGESKYGKPILDRIIRRNITLEDAARCAIVSMDSTIASNATVGPPIEVLVYEKDTFETDHYIKLDVEDPYLKAIKHSWNESLKKAFSSLPLFHWEQRSAPVLQSVPDTWNQNQTPGQS